MAASVASPGGGKENLNGAWECAPAVVDTWPSRLTSSSAENPTLSSFSIHLNRLSSIHYMNFVENTINYSLTLKKYRSTQTDRLIYDIKVDCNQHVALLARISQLS